MTGREKCRILRKIRNDVAVKNGLKPFEDTCTHKGECAGTCPKCESEAKILSLALEKRRARRKRVALAGVSVGVCAALTGCSADKVISAIDMLLPTRNDNPPVIELMGDVPYDANLPGIPDDLMGEVAMPEDRS